MKKPKIAISLDNSLLKQIDSKVDHSIIRSRSQAIEYFLRKGLKESSIAVAVLLVKKEHQPNLLKDVRGKPLIKRQIEFFYKNGIKTLYIITQHTPFMSRILLQVDHFPLDVKVVEKNVKGNADALFGLKDFLYENFVVMSGDTYNDFDLIRMIKKHLELDKLGTMGLMSVDKPSKYGNAILDGDLIIDFFYYSIYIIIYQYICIHIKYNVV